MKVNSVQNIQSAGLKKASKSNQHPSFKGVGTVLGDLNKFAMKKIEKGGFFAEFVILDMCGLVLPRVYQGFQRNKEELGHLNYQAGTEEFLREFITGPSLFLIPLASVLLAGKALGRGVQINSNTMKKFTQTFKELGENIAKSDLVQNQKAFASKLFDNLFTKNPSKLQDAIPSTVKSFEDFKKPFVELLTSNLNGKDNLAKGKFADLIADINASFFNKKHTEAVDIILPNKTAGTTAGDLFEDARKYMQDVIPSTKLSLNELVGKGGEIAKDAIDTTVDKITKIRENGRKVLCLGGTAALAAFLSIIPKIYQRSKTNPALNGLVPEAGKEQK